MTDETLPRCDYYVYGLFSEAGAIFYVGKGRDRRHLTSATVNGSGKNDLKARAIKRVRETLGEVPIVLLADNLTEDDAYRIERLFITAIGRRHDGPLLNMSDGGEGFSDPTGAVAEKIRQTLTGFKHGPEARENMRRSKVGRIISQETRDKLRAIMRERFPEKPKPPKKKRKLTKEQADKLHAARRTKIMTAEQRENYRRAATGRRHSDETKNKIREIRTGSKASPETRAKIAAAGVGREWSQEARQRLSQKKLGWKPSEETIKRMSEGQRRRYQRK